MSKKLYFTLKNISPHEIDLKYGLSILSNNVILPKNTTKIKDLSLNKVQGETYSYMDETKKKHECIFTMVDHLSNGRLLGTTSMSCFWCRHPFQTSPIGCPIEYIPSILIKNYYSEITKDNYTIRQKITPNMKKIITLFI